MNNSQEVVAPSSKDRRRTLQEYVAEHVASGWRLIEQLDECAVLAWGPPNSETRRVIKIDAAGELFFKDAGGGFRPVNGAPTQASATAAAGARLPASVMPRWQKWLVACVSAPFVGLFLIAAWSGGASEFEYRRLRASVDESKRAADALSAVADTVGLSSDSGGQASMAEFLQLRQGMTYAQAVAIIGSPGEEISRMDTTVMYQWKGNSLVGNMNAMFQDDRLVSKAQMGLR
jgi:hypothetical protein